MSKFTFKSISGFALASIISVGAVADPILLVSHNAMVGPKKEALIACVEAARNNSEFGNGLVLSRGSMKYGPTGRVRVLRLNGTSWENGARVPVVVSCVTGNAEGTVASISRVRTESKVAAAK